MKLKQRITNRVIKQARKGFRGYPIATVAYYGPDDRKATKVAVGIIAYEDAPADPMQRWYSEARDVRFDDRITDQVLKLIKSHNVVSVAAVGRILGCPHEEGIDYPGGQPWTQCPFWAGRDRFAGVAEELQKSYGVRRIDDLVSETQCAERRSLMRPKHANPRTARIAWRAEAPFCPLVGTF